MTTWLFDVPRARVVVLAAAALVLDEPPLGVEARDDPDARVREPDRVPEAMGLTLTATDDADAEARRVSVGQGPARSSAHQ